MKKSSEILTQQEIQQLLSAVARRHRRIKQFKEAERLRQLREDNQRGR